MMSKTRPMLVLATGNPHKVEEIAAILREAAPEASGWTLRSAADWADVAEPEETGETFEANARLKAEYWARQTGCLALADDSGLVIDALDGRPGVRSARYASTPELRILRVLEEMREVPAEKRRARFVCVAALADPEGGGAVHEGRIEGWITRGARGDGGFGYDPIFEPDTGGRPEGRTLAQYSAEEKNGISHRSRAMRGLAETIARSVAAGLVTEARK